MSENQLEDILSRFLDREFDILVTTTIIETGIDMPNVNTMIIEDADHYGLSQLYQLRGRIGRSARLAYAYFLYQPNKVLTEVGEKRLDASGTLPSWGQASRSPCGTCPSAGPATCWGPSSTALSTASATTSTHRCC